MMRQQTRSVGQNAWVLIDPNSSAKPYIATSFAFVPKLRSMPGEPLHSQSKRKRWLRSQTGVRPRTGRTGPMQRGEIWFAATRGGDRPVLVLTRDPVVDRIGSVVVAALTRTRRGLVSELELSPDVDGVPTSCVANFDNLHTLPREAFRRRVTKLSEARLAESCRVLRDATGC